MANNYEIPGASPDNYITAPDHTPKPEMVNTYFQPPKNYQALPPQQPILPPQPMPPPPLPAAPPAPLPDSSSRSNKDSLKSQNGSQKDIGKSKKKSKGKPKKDQTSGFGAVDPEKPEETVVVTKRVKTFARTQHKQARTVKICICSTTVALILFGLVLSAFIATTHFTECFGECDKLRD